MAKPTELWKQKRKHIDEVTYILTDLGNMNRDGELVGWIGHKAYIKLNQAGHSAIDFNQCKCKNHA